MPFERTATFRPPLRNATLALALGAAGGAVLGRMVGASPLVSLAFGALAAALALGIRRLAGLTVIARESGLRVRAAGASLRAEWSALRLSFGASQREDGSVQRCAVLSDPPGRSFAFADLGGAPPCKPITGADGRPLEVVDLRDAPLLLALVVQRVPAWNVFPESVQPLPIPTPDAPPPGSEKPVLPARPALQIGLWALAAKMASKVAAAFAKLGAGGFKAVKGGQVGWAVLSVASYGLLFSWRFALALMLQLLVHEYGHVHAMRRCGMRVRGLYFVPFLGALAVSQDAFRSRRDQAYVALSGPIWGSVLTFAAAGAYRVSGDPLFAAVAAWWALINLFNLLPISPLDGGRAMQAFACSFSTGAGHVLSVLGLAAATVAALSLGFSVLYLVCLLGALELFSEAQARDGARALQLLPEPGRFGMEHFRFLRSTMGPPPGHLSEALFVRRIQIQQRAARVPPLAPAPLAAWAAAYVALAGTLVALVHFMRDVPGAEAAARFLR